MRFRSIHVLLIATALAVRVSAQEVAEEQSGVQPEIYRTSRDLRELAHIQLSSNVTFGVQLEIKASYEKQGTNETSDLVLDGLELAFDVIANEWLEGHLLLSHEEEDDGDDTIVVDEAFLRFGGTDDQPYYAEVGRMELPFGEYNTHFIEDAILQFIGETKDDALTAGYEGDLLEVGASVFQGDTEGDDTIDEFIVFAKLDPTDSIECGVYWMSDIGESDELSVIIDESLKEDAVEEPVADVAVVTDEDEEEDSTPEPAPPPPLKPDDEMGMGGFIAFDNDLFFADLEYVSALGSFEPGLLADERSEPWAWNTEAGWRPVEAWEIALRIEHGDDVPDNPAWQYGIATSYGFSETLTLSADYLRGDFVAGEDDRDLVEVKASFRY
jgi:hypothetical protein